MVTWYIPSAIDPLFTCWQAQRSPLKMGIAAKISLALFPLSTILTWPHLKSKGDGNQGLICLMDFDVRMEETWKQHIQRWRPRLNESNNERLVNQKMLYKILMKYIPSCIKLFFQQLE